MGHRHPLVAANSRGAPDAAETLARALGGAYVPALVAAGEPVGPVPGTERGTPARATAAAHVCRHSTCGAPATTAAALAAQLGGG